MTKHRALLSTSDKIKKPYNFEKLDKI